MDHRRVDRVGLLSPLEESSAEISRDSGIVSQSASSLSMVSDILSSGTLSQSPSFGAAANVVASPSPSLHEAASASQQGPEGHGDDDLVHTAFTYSSYVKATAGEEILCLEKSLEEMLTRVDEFVGMLDMIRSDTSQIVSENIPQIQQKSEEIRQLYRRIDQLEGFVKMVGANVGAMEEQLTEAEGELSTLPGAFKKIFRTISVPSFLNGGEIDCQRVGEGFVQWYYNQFDHTNRMELVNLYAEGATLTWEGTLFHGREAIAGKLTGMPFQQIKHIVTEQDIQPTIDNSILIMVFGQLKTDNDPPLAFHQVFMLKPQNCNWVCTNDVFRLGIHNIAVEPQ